MTHFEYTQLFFSKYLNYIICLLIFIVYYLLFKKEIFSLFDPLVIALIPLAITASILVILKINGLIELNVFLYIIGTEVCFIIGYKLFSKIKIKNRKSQKNTDFFKCFYKIHTLFFMIFLFLLFKNIGILVLKNQLEVFSSNLVNKLTQYGIYMFFPGQLILFIARREKYKIKKKGDFFYFLFLFFIFFSTGKVGIVNFFAIMLTTYYVLNEEEKNLEIQKKFYDIKKKEVYIIVLTMFSLVFSFALNGNINKILIIINRFIERMLAFGDIYFLTLVNNNFEKIVVNELYKYYLWWIVGPISLLLGIQVEKPIQIGFEAMKVAYNWENPHWGANTRYNIIFLIFRFHWIVAMSLSLVYGFVINYMRRKKFFKNDTIRLYFRVSIINIVGMFLSDTSVFGAYMLPLVAFFPMIIIISFLFFMVHQNNKKNFNIKNVRK